MKETLHLFCLATIVFRILPLLDAVEVCAYLSGIPLVPSLLHSISYRKKCMRNIGKQIINIFSFLVQLGAVLIVPILKFQNKKISAGEIFLMIFCAICFSVRWYETYFKYKRNSFFDKIFNYDNRVKTHAASTLASSFLRLVLAMVLFPTFLAPGVHEPSIVFTSVVGHTTNVSAMNASISSVVSINGTSDNTTIGGIKYIEEWLVAPFLTHFFTSMCLFYGAVIATRLCMDKLCFCFALSIATPAYVIGVVVSRSVADDQWINTYLKMKDNSGGRDTYIAIATFFLVWLSQLWTCRHIWLSLPDRMAFTSK